MLKLNWTGVEENLATYATIPIPHAQFAFIKEKLGWWVKTIPWLFIKKKQPFLA